MITIDSSQFYNIPPCCVVLGNFDGVHLGHTALINSAKAYAKENNLPVLVYTFAVHPKFYFNNNFKLITVQSEKVDIFSKLGIDYLYLEDFTLVRNYNPGQFCNDILINKLHAKAVFCGKNHRFGSNASGNSDNLKEYLEKNNTSVFVEDFYLYNDLPVSSSRIRNLIDCGDIPYANTLLGRCFSVDFPVIHGFHLGTKLGFPTINQIMPDDKLTPPYGVYACYTHINGKTYPSVLNVGTKPTVTHNYENPPVICETHIMDFDGDLYGKKIKVDFVGKIRDEKKFSGIQELKNAVLKDIDKAKNILESSKNEI